LSFFKNLYFFSGKMRRGKLLKKHIQIMMQPEKVLTGQQHLIWDYMEQLQLS